AEDDPFMTIDVVPTESELSSSVTLELSKKGGHVGFIASDGYGLPAYWLDQRIPEYFSSQFKGF
ncbi:MAG: hydrolase, partial [Legionella sp.]|nr:hydrolase [Legionella sp.]